MCVYLFANAMFSLVFKKKKKMPSERTYVLRFSTGST